MVKFFVIDGDGAGFKEDLALPFGPRLASNDAPFPNALPLWARGVRAGEDEVINRHQHIVWCDRHSLCVEQVN